MRWLLITPRYPADDDLYALAFVHTRVKAYRALGRDVSVFVYRYNLETPLDYWFEGVSVRRGNWEALRRCIEEGWDRILIHAATASIWSIVDRYGDRRVPLLVWVHGAEAEKWDRRLFDFDRSSSRYQHELQEAKERSENRLALMAEIYSSPRVLTIFVSDWFRTNVAEVDSGIAIENFQTIPDLPLPISSS